MDASTWLEDHATVRIDQDTFACLDGCGFCCTYPPQVTQDELRELEQRTTIPSVGVGPDGGMHIPLKGGCGGCSLLEDRRCTAYQARPMHCRLFPFHVYLGRRVEVYANRVCPGLDPDPDQIGPEAETPTKEIPQALERAFDAARLQDLEDKHEQAQHAYQAFEDHARAEDAWSDPRDAILEAREEASITRQAWNAAITPFDVDDEAALPTMVLPRAGFPWRAWRWKDHTFVQYAFSEDGTLTREGSIPAPSPREPVPEACFTVLDRLTGYACFEGGVFDRVDHAGYGIQLRSAAQGEADEVLAELTVRAYLLDAEDLPVTPRWLAASYEPAFFDRPTIGAWL